MGWGWCSLLHPSPTVAEGWQSLPAVLGLVLVCFAGHAVLPTLRNDMADRRHYGRSVLTRHALTRHVNPELLSPRD